MTAKRLVLGAITIALLVAALVVLHRSLQSMALAELDAALRGTPVGAIVGSLLATATSFAILGYYDHVAIRVVAPGRVTRRRAFQVGAISHAVSNTLGFHIVTGVAVRYRLYAASGLGALDSARATAIVGLCVALGSVALLALLLLVEPDVFAGSRALGVTLALAVACVLAAFPLLTGALRLRRPELALLRRRMLVTPLLAGLVEGAAAIAAFNLLLPADIGPGFVAVAVVVMAAVLLGVLSHAPGGVGVFEATVLAAFPVARHADVLAALLLYRLLYNLVPFTIACIALGIEWLLDRRLPSIESAAVPRMDAPCGGAAMVVSSTAGSGP